MKSLFARASIPNLPWRCWIAVLGVFLIASSSAQTAPEAGHQPSLRATLIKKTVTDTSFSVTVKVAMRSSTFDKSGPLDPDVRAHLDQLVEGQEYEYPKVFSDLDSASDRRGQAILVEAFPFTYMTFLNLRDEPSFHAVVKHKVVTDDTYRFLLQIGSKSFVYEHKSDFGIHQRLSEDERKVLDHLIDDQEYEFPQVIDDLLGPSRWNLSILGSELLGLHDAAPFRAKVTTRTVASSFYTLLLDNGHAYIKNVRFGKDEHLVLDHLVEGQEYEFPKVFDDLLGPSPKFLLSSPPDLPKMSPFQSRLSKKIIAPNYVRIVLDSVDGRRFDITEENAQALDAARHSVEPLQEGEIYDFPEAILHPGAVTAALVPASPAMKALEGFVGSWETSTTGKPDQKNITRYYWRHDGLGLWREVYAAGPRRHTLQQTLEATATKLQFGLLTYDALKQRYVDVPLRPSDELGAIEGVWNAESRTLTLSGPANYPGYQSTFVSTRTFQTPDRFEWRVRYTSKDGKETPESSAIYTRVK